mmetsp:Transcript_8188/g.20282  ORF Transcript_8188/g.20282 Transcript_8188/m.20282 type:complete len:316 (+) Transcript_8188:750-1697(+)
MAAVAAHLTRDQRDVCAVASHVLVRADLLRVSGSAAGAAHAQALYVAQSAVDERQLAQLGALVLVVILVDGAQQRLDHGGGAVHLLVGVPSDQHVQVFVLMRVVLARIAARPLLHRPLAADGDARVGLALHALLRVAARANNQADKVVPRELLERDDQLACLLGRAPVGGGAEHVRTPRHQPPDEVRALLHHLLPDAHLPRVLPHTVCVIPGRRRGRPCVLGSFVGELVGRDALRHVGVPRVLPHHLGVVALRGRDAVFHGPGVLALRHDFAYDSSQVGLDRSLVGHAGSPTDERERAANRARLFGGLPATLALA